MSANITIVGRLGKDPEAKTSNGGASYVTFTVATDYGFGDRKVVTWWKVTAFGKTAEFVSKYVRKGDMVEVRGEAYIEEWIGRDQAKHTDGCCKADAVNKLTRNEATTGRTDAPARGGYDDEPPF